MKWWQKLSLALVALVVLAVVALLAMGQRTGAGVVAASVSIRRPAAQVFPWLVDAEKNKQWVSWLREIRVISPGVNGVGAKEVWVMADQNNGGAPMEIASESTVYEPPRRLGARLHAADLFDGEVSYELVETNGDTEVRSHGRYHYHHWFARLLEPVITPEARKKFVADLATLKEKVEHAP